MSEEDKLSDAEADKRMNDALRRALKTPPQPHAQSTPKTNKAASKKKAAKG